MIWPNLRIGCALRDRHDRDLVALRHPLQRDHAVGQRRALVDGVDGDDDIVARVEAKGAGQVLGQWSSWKDPG